MKSTLPAILFGLSFFFLAIGTPVNAADNTGVIPGQTGKYTIFGIGIIGDGLNPELTNNSLYNGPNIWNILETEQQYAGPRSLSWNAAAPFERGWLVSTTPFDMGRYQYLNFYAKATQAGQRYEVGFVDRNGNMVGTWVPVESGGGPIQPDRWQLYNWPLSTFAVNTEAYGIGFRDMNGAPQPKVYFDEIQLSDSPGSAPVLSPGLGQPAIPAEPAKPKGPYYPEISPWVFIIPGIIILLAIFFE